MEVQARTAANRRLLADFFDRLDDDQLATPSLCEGWTVRDVLGHVVTPSVVRTTTFLGALVRARGSLDATTPTTTGRHPASVRSARSPTSASTCATARAHSVSRTT